MSLKVYQGLKKGGYPGPGTVLVDGKPLKHIVRHSPDGFNWGYGGSGPADLALSILTDYLVGIANLFSLSENPRDKPIEIKRAELIADAYYQEFKWKFIANLPIGQDWEIKSSEIAEFIFNKFKKA